VKHSEDQTRVTLGVGANYHTELHDFFLENTKELHFLEFIVENTTNPQYFTGLLQLAPLFPFTAHGISMSIGSAEPLDSEKVELWRAVAKGLKPVWFSEHIAFTCIGGAFHQFLGEEDFELLASVQNDGGKTDIDYVTLRKTFGPPRHFFVSRVVALEGEVVEFRPEGLFINNKRLRPPARLGRLFQSFPDYEKYRFGSKALKLKKGTVFVINDNRARVTDSRRIGPIYLGHILAHVTGVSTLSKLPPAVRAEIEEFHDLRP
jgi:signal peptidase I